MGDDESDVELMDRLRFIEQVHKLPDEMLANLVRVVNSGDNSIGLTLSVAGTLVTGTAISQPNYIDRLEQQLLGDEPATGAWNDFKVGPGDVDVDDERSPKYVHTWLTLRSSRASTGSIPRS